MIRALGRILFPNARRDQRRRNTLTALLVLVSALIVCALVGGLLFFLNLHGKM